MQYNYIGENIRKYRRRANLTQQQLADKIGISWEMISRYERSESSPLKKLLPLSSALKVSESQLLEKHVPQRYHQLEYKIPLFLHYPFSNKFDANQTNYFYICPEWIIKRDRLSIAIDSSLITSGIENLKQGGIVYISTKCLLQKDDLVLRRESCNLIVDKYKGNKNLNILGKVLAQEIRY